MPYIRADRRDTLTATTAGELNYLITRLCLQYLGPDPSYDLLNTIVGALECCKLEFYRRAVAPFEEQKRFENGEVY